MVEKTKHDGAVPNTAQQRDAALKAAMETFAERLIGSQTNGNLVFEFDPASLVVQGRLTFIHLQTLIECLIEAGLPIARVQERFRQNIEKATEELRKPTIAASVGQIIRS
jgi:hypothetical protein